jgi:hypothetical protein
MIKNGDIFDIGQTVNGHHVFMWLHGKWYYRKPGTVPGTEYEYSQEDLTKTVEDSLLNEDNEVIRIGNLFAYKNFR